MPQPLLTRFQTTVLRDKSPSDERQVPATASIDFYRQGATVKTAFTLPALSAVTQIEVEDTGRIKKLDALDVFSRGNSDLEGGDISVDEIIDHTHLNVKNEDNQSISAAVGDRLVLMNNRPQAHENPLGTDTPGSSVATDADTGRAAAYISELRFDYIISGNQFDSRLYVDAKGGFIKSDLAWINVLDYPSIQAAVDAVPPDGGVVYIPQNQQPYDKETTPSYTAPLNLPPDRAVHLLGDGPFRTYLQANTTEFPDLDMIKMGGDYQTIEGLTVRGDDIPTVGKNGRGIVIWRTGDYVIPPPPTSTATNLIYRAAIRNCRIQKTPSWGLYISDELRNSQEQGTVWGMYDGIEIRNNNDNLAGCVYVGAGKTTTQYFKNCNFKDYLGYGVFLNNSSGVSLIDCIIENQFTDTQPYVKILNSVQVLLSGCWFEGKVPAFKDAPENFYIETEGTATRNISIDSCRFVRSPAFSSPQFNPKVLLVRSGARAVQMRNFSIVIAGGSESAGDNHIEIEEDVQAMIVGGVSQDTNGHMDPVIKDVGAAANGKSPTMLLNSMRRLRLSRLGFLEAQALQNKTISDTVWVVDPFGGDDKNLLVWNGTEWKAAKLINT